MKKKILYVHHSGGLGGAPRSLSLLLGQLNQTKYSAKILCIYKGPVITLLQRLNIPLIIEERIYPFHGSTVVRRSLEVFLVNLLGSPLSFIYSLKILKKEKPDIVHLNSSCLFITALAAKVLSRRTKVICHVREPLRDSLAGRIIRYMCFKLVDHFVAIDRFTGSTMRAHGNIEIIYNPVDFESYNPTVNSNILSRELGLGTDDVVFLYLARIAPGNGTLELIEIANRLKDSHPTFHFVIAGLKEQADDSYSIQVVESCKDNNNIHLMKFREDVPSLIASSDIVLVPFTEPHFARAAIEAAAMGKPCIGANIGGVDELIIHGKTGLLYTSLDEFSKFCEDLGENPNLRNQLGQEAVIFARDNFDVKRSSERVFAIYEK